MENKAKKKYTIDELREIVKKLRGENGCPWDRVQTHESIKNCMIEESYEAIDALDKGNDALFANELGDLLFQVVFHAQLASERGAFDFDDVVYEISQKMIDRHTHVFGSDKAENADDALDTWEKNKKKEKGLKSQTEAMRDIVALPALMRAQKVQKKAADVGFDWDDVSGALDKVREETDELCEAVEQNNAACMEEELGDLLFSVVNVSRFLKLSSEEALKRATNKFIDRFAVLEQSAQQNGQNLSKMTLEELESLWQQAKKADK